jgi:hypothetical protein
MSMRRDVRTQLSGNSKIVEQPQDLVIDRDRARLVVDGAVPVDGQRADTFRAQQAGGDGARRTEAHDSDLKLVRAVRTGYQALHIPCEC